MTKALYICYFGVDEPLVSSQVLPYLREIAGRDVQVSLLTFEKDADSKWDGESLRKKREELLGSGIEWSHLPYHKRPSVPATVYDILVGAFVISRMIRERGIGVLHARVHVPAMMAVLARLMSGEKGVRVIFDIRGFFPEEYVDAGIWRRDGLVFRAVKAVERWLLSRSDGFVVLTEKAKTLLADGMRGRPVEVIPCCVDTERFAEAKLEDRRQLRQDLGIGDRLVAVYVGSFGGWYLTEETFVAFQELRKMRPDAFAMILTQSDPKDISARIAAAGFESDDFMVRKIPTSEMPGYLSCADIAFSFIKPCYSKLASSPTKNAEYLACGLPILANDGIGDTTEQLTEDRTGVVISDLTRSGIRLGLEELLRMVDSNPDIASRCRVSAETRFSLKKLGGPAYRRLYKAVIDRGGDA